MKPYQVLVFGKTGCEKCKVLQKRVGDLLARPEWAEAFDWQYVDVETEEGLVQFCRAECINPQRIPALLVTRFDPAAERHEPIPWSALGGPETLPAASRLYLYVGLQTDYSPAGKGVISPRMIAATLEEARRSARETVSA